MGATPRSQTGKLDIKSKLVRNSWMKEGLIQKQSISFWAPLKGTTLDAVIVQSQTSTAEEGHTIVMDYDGNYAGAARRGKEKAYGYGGVKLKFSDKLTSERLRYPINNGDKFDGTDIGDLSINEHVDSRTKLADNWIRQNDQFWFDIGVGYLRGVKPTHAYLPNGKTTSQSLVAGDVLDYDELISMETAIKTGKGFSIGGDRRPMKGYAGGDANNGANAAPIYLVVCTPGQMASLKLDPKFQTIVSTADIRGRENMALSGIQGKVGNLVFREAPTYFGYEETPGNNQLGKSIVEMSGLRRVKILANGTEKYEGTEAYDLELTAGTKIVDRGLIIGAGAFSEGIGMDPDYKFQSSEDFGIDSESMMEWWGNAQATMLTPEVEDYKKAKISNMTYGLAYFDTWVATL